MNLPLTLRPRAEADVEDAFVWYETRLPGLGEAFLRSVGVCLDAIQRYPEAHPAAHVHVRRASLRQFPYGVFYVIREDRIDVLAVYHARRQPRAFRP